MKNVKFVWIYYWMVFGVCLFCVLTKMSIDVSSMFVGFTGFLICFIAELVVYLNKVQYSNRSFFDEVFAFMVLLGALFSGAFIWMEGFLNGRVEWMPILSEGVMPDIIYIGYILSISSLVALFQINFKVPEGAVINFEGTMLFPGDKFTFNPFVNPSLLREKNFFLLDFADYTFRCKDGKYSCEWSIGFLIQRVSPNDYFSAGEFFQEIEQFKGWYCDQLESLAEQHAFSEFTGLEVDLGIYPGKLCFQITENREMIFITPDPHGQPAV